MNWFLRGCNDTGQLYVRCSGDGGVMSVLWGKTDWCSNLAPPWCMSAMLWGKEDWEESMETIFLSFYGIWFGVKCVMPFTMRSMLHRNHVRLSQDRVCIADKPSVGGTVIHGVEEDQGLRDPAVQGLPGCRDWHVHIQACRQRRLQQPGILHLWPEQPVSISLSGQSLCFTSIRLSLPQSIPSLSFS